MIRVQHSVVIERPVAKVWAALMDFADEPHWQPAVIEASHTPAGPIGVGTQLRQVRRFMDRPLETLGEVVAYEQNRLMESVSAPGIAPAFHITYQVAPVVQATRLVFTIELMGSGFFKLIQPLVRRNVQRDVVTRFATLKRMLEV